MKHLPLEQWPKQAFAGFWIRVAAYLIDRLMIAALMKIIFNLTIHRWYFSTELDTLWWYRLLQVTLVVLYFVISMWFLEGQTIGKNLLGLKVISTNTESDHKPYWIIRETAGRIILYYFPILSISLVFTEQRQHLIDLFCDTAVINQKSVNDLEEFLTENNLRVNSL